jgi:hypothetical protein
VITITVRTLRSVANQQVAILPRFLPLLLMVVVVGWSALLFFCFGLLATLSWISVLAQFLGSLAVAAAFFMILEFSSPVPHFAGRDR